MATTNDWASALEQLDDSFPDTSKQPTGYSFLDVDIGATLEEAKRISANTADKAYRKLTSHANVTSYSLLTQLHDCPRRFELDKLQANAEAVVVDSEVNLDFAYGHAVGAGIQTYAATGSLLAAQFAAFCAWRAPWDASKVDKRGRESGKSLAHALIAVERFQYFWARNLSDYEVVKLPNGNNATELAFAVDFENGFYHFGHIDTVLRNKSSGALAVWEGKTTGFQTVDEATYANSSQALGYSVVVDAIAREIGSSGTEYEVLYIVYSSSTGEFSLLPFGKTRTQRAEWLQDTLLDHANIGTYQRIGFYPKRGESCINQWGRKCQWFGQCQMSNESLMPGVVAPKLENVHGIESLDFDFKLSDLLATQKGK